MQQIDVDFRNEPKMIDSLPIASINHLKISGFTLRRLVTLVIIALYALITQSY